MQQTIVFILKGGHRMKPKVKLLILILSVFILVLNGCQKVVNYTVNFNSKGGTEVAPIQVKKGETIVLPANPTKEEHEFLEWTLDGETFDEKMTIAKDITLVAVWEIIVVTEDPKEEDPELVEVKDTAKLSKILESFSGRLGYSFCSLDTDLLEELYSGNVNVDSFSNNTLLLIAMNNEAIHGEYSEESDLLFAKSFLNEKIRKILNINKDIDFNTIETEINNFHYENVSNQHIKLYIQIFGCMDNLDDMFKQVVKGEEDEQYLYIYERIAFGRNTAPGEMSYYGNPNLNNVIEKFDYDMTLPTSQINVNKYPIYKYKFLKVGTEYKLESIVVD